MTEKEINNHGLTPTSFQLANMVKLAGVITELEQYYGKPFQVTSGLRSKELQAQINPVVKNSAHMTGEAVDVADVDGSIYSFCIDNPDIIIRLGIFIELRTWTPRWLHAQIRPTTNRFFIP